MSANAPLDDQTAAGVRARDPDALAAVWHALAPGLIAWLRSQLRHEQDAEDVAMATFQELVAECHRIDGGPEQIRAWLFRAAYHNLLDHRRARSRRPEDPTDAVPEPTDADEPGDVAATADLRRRLERALDQLAPDQRTVLSLRFLGQLSAPEIAQVMDRTVGSVRQLQHRGTQRLAALIRDGTVPIQPDEAP